MTIFSSSHDVRARFLRAGRIPFGLATILSIYGLVVESAGGTRLSRLGLTPFGLVTFYFGVALFATVVLILFGSWATSRLRASALGFASGAMLAFILNLVLALRPGDQPISGLGLVLYMATLGLVPGAIAGAMFWKPSTNSE